MMNYDVFARNGCHGQNEDIKKSWSWMGCFKAESAEDAARAVHDDVKARYPKNWAAWTLADFKARENKNGRPFPDSRAASAPQEETNR